MRCIILLLAAVAVGIGSPCIASAQTYLLAETPREGDCFRLTARTSLTGTIKVTRDGRQVPMKIAATNEHSLLERILVVEKGLPRKTLRQYLTAVSRAAVESEKMERTLPDNRKLIVAQRAGDALFCYSPSGPLARTELEVVSEHFETLHLTGVLPGREVRVGDSWKLDSPVAQSLCLFDGLIAHELTGKLAEVSGSTAVISVAGTARGIENGALANLTVAATVRFDLAAKRISSVDWKQKDTRDQGPTSPAAEVESTTTFQRETLDREPNELNAEVVAALPAGNDPPATMQQLIHRDPRARYQLLHGRDWFIVAQTDYHLVLRLLDRGDFIAQATVTYWKNAGAGKHMAAEEFEKLIAAPKNWQAEQILDRSELPTDSDRWMYRVVARGELDGTKVVQSFYVIAAASGEQMIVTFTMKPNAADRLGTRDVALVQAIDFAKK
jgi:hypothetical protein